MGPNELGLREKELSDIKHVVLFTEKRLGEMLEKLKEIILEKSFRYSEEPIFELANAGKSKFYFDCKPAVLDPEGAEIVARLIFDKIKDLDISAIGGLELGAVPISSIVTLLSQQEGKPLKGFIVRKEIKGHGIKAKVEGEIKPGEKVVVVDDVITTGKSTIKAINTIAEIGVKVEKVIVLVDREELNGRQNIQQLCPNVESLIKRSEIENLYNKRKQQDRAAVG
jgi:orotate phosphoribosyltransferase